MRINSKSLEAAANAHSARLESPLWKESSDRPITVGDAQVSPTDPTPHLPQNHSTTPTSTDPELREFLTEIATSIKHLADSVAVLQSQHPNPDKSWITEAAGNPRIYDSPDPARENVCVRLSPTLYRTLQDTQKQLGLRTRAGAWELVVRLGVAAASKLPNPLT